jgi:NTE family protein
MSSSPVAFVLSGGGSLGAVQVGLAHALYERGIRPDLIVGTSAGAINGGFLASHPATTETTSALAERWRATKRSDVFPLNLTTGLRGLTGSSNHVAASSGLARVIARNVGDARLEDVPTPLHCVAVDVLTGEELLLSRGPIAQAALASASIPGVLPPVPWGNRLLMDGGVANNTPISHAIALGARELYVLPAGHACALTAPPSSALGMALHALTLLTHSRLIADIALHAPQAKIVVLPPPCPLAVSPVDFSQAQTLIRRALDGARQFLDSGGAQRSPIRMTMHRHGDHAGAPAEVVVA